ncbi:ArsA family ATPase [Streptomyces somaliensis]|uniref:ArsA family ATPase n=1 Tax=Streptomyces somaliensis (strain ATCC 33201 / DSM 40738 / JCM 12659 / KCTC 9044 / NCTC 11332 / NRRL B-12077 / IP 733) TaxID=1134445 RepID=A0AA44DFJ5_STRE0|nr:ArsA family ATPase [Streptomyces somaliensis]NKY15365.1 ArsA family ATPase [Streptomyces somaliensis DSM 40738]
MRTLLVTGPGGAGRSTVAAATALDAAREGRRVLLLTADPAPALAAGGDGPTVHRLDPAARFREEVLALQARAAPVLELLGAAPLDDDELAPLPGSTHLAYLKALRDAARGDWDLLVADLPPLPDAIALLALPERLRRYLRRLLPPERRAARGLRPVLARLAEVPVPADGLYEEAARRDAALAAVQELLGAPRTSVRLVVEPGPATADALRTARAGLALHRLALDPVVANRLLPAASPDPWLAALATRQRAHLEELYGDGGGPVSEVPHLGRDPRTADDLALLGAPAPGADPVPAPRWAVEDRRAADGVLVWRIPLPGAAKPDLGLVRRGDDLLLTVGPFRRAVPLPSALRRCTVTGAALRDGELRVRFAPAPGLWPGTP